MKTIAKKFGLILTLALGIVLMAFLFTGCEKEKFTVNLYSNNVAYGTVYGTGSYEKDKEVTIRAVANSGYQFQSWNDGNTEAIRTIIITQNCSYTATFAPGTSQKFTLTVASNNTEYGTVTGGGEFDYGTQTVITATANAGYTFISWNDGSAVYQRAITITSNCTYTASFAPEGTIPLSVVVNSNNALYGTVTGGGVYLEGQVISIKATANEGYKFVSWNDSSTENPRAIVVNSTTAKTYTATFMATSTEKFDITFVADSKILSTTSYQDGSTYAMPSAPSKSGYSFIGWGETALGKATWTDPNVVQYATGAKTWFAQYAQLEQAWDGITLMRTLYGSGTEQSPYLIATAEQLYFISIEVSDGTNYSGKYFKMVSDIYLGGTYNKHEWIPIGTFSKSFQGTFDGNGYTIRHLSITSGSNIGLFAFVENATIKNLTLSNSLSSFQIVGNYDVGSIAGQAKNSTITNCKSDICVQGNSYVGGIIGLGDNVIIKNCTNNGVIATTNSGTNVGGIAGYIQQQSSFIQQCSNTATLNCPNTTNVGGICGCSQGNVVNCANLGTISCGNFSGGIVGYLYGTSASANIEKCYNTANIKNPNSNTIGYLGGICGFAQFNGYIKDTYNTGDVSGTGFLTGIDHVGGICGYAEHTQILTSYNTGGVSGKNYVGGICGILKSDSYLNQCYNTGTVYDGSTYLGAIAGIVSGGATGTNYYLKNCANINGFYQKAIGNSTSATSTDPAGTVVFDTNQDVYSSIYNNSSFNNNTWSKYTTKMPTLK